jgi:decaprenylphospho-beta-D-ribofuranose 2-oxidase
LNPLSIAAFNALYWRRVPPGGCERRLAYDRFLYPLDTIIGWNRLYGRRGFHQFQALVPDSQGIRALLEACAAARAASFLAVLKTTGQEGIGLLSFGGRGYTLALDFPAGAGIEDLLRRLEHLTLDHGGRIYLAKDSCLSAAGFAAMYPRLPEFRRILAEVDPEGRMHSDLARRLAIREDA